MTYTLFARSRSRLCYLICRFTRPTILYTEHRESGFIGASLLKLCGYHDGGCSPRQLSKSVRHAIERVSILRFHRTSLFWSRRWFYRSRKPHVRGVKLGQTKATSEKLLVGASFSFPDVYFSTSASRFRVTRLSEERNYHFNFLRTSRVFHSLRLQSYSREFPAIRKRSVIHV